MRRKTARLILISLEFGNLQQLIYTDLARNIGESKDDPSVQHVIDIVKSNLDLHHGVSKEETVVESAQERIFMVRCCPTL